MICHSCTCLYIPMSQFQPGGLAGLSDAALASRRRKKRTSIDTAVRVALEKSFLGNPKPTSEEISLISDTLQMEKEVGEDMLLCITCKLSPQNNCLIMNFT